MAQKLDSIKWLRKKAALFEEKSYPALFAALLHIYLGSLTFKDIAEHSGMTRDALAKLRKNPRFMRFVDTFKKDISGAIREDLIVNNYALEDYDSLAADFSLCDEIFQMQIRVPLFSRLKSVSEKIDSRHTHGLKLDQYELRLFRKLFCFFVFAEKYTPTLVSRSLQDMKRIAEDIVWPALELDEKEIDHLLRRPSPDKNGRLNALRQALKSLRS